MKTVLAYVGTVFVALAASACCWIPVLLGAGAAGSIGISAALAPWRPYLLVLTSLFLLGGFWVVYRKPKEDCCHSDGVATSAVAKRRKLNIKMMWVAAVFVLTMAAYPNILAARSSEQMNSTVSTNAPGTSTLAFSIEGMDCEACTQPIKTKVEKVPGVLAARVDFPNKQLVISANHVDPALVLEAVRKAGFKVSQTGDNEQ